MPVRGTRPIYPGAKAPEQGIFSSRGKQKVDSTAKFPNQGTRKMALGCSTRSKPKSNGGAGLAHQPPKKGW